MLGAVLGGLAQRQAAHLPLQGVRRGERGAPMRGEQARELVSGAAEQGARGAVEEDDGEDAVVGGHGEEKPVDARRGGAAAGPAGGALRVARERAAAAGRAGEVREVGRVGRHDGAVRWRPRRRRAAAGERHPGPSPRVAVRFRPTTATAFFKTLRYDF